MLPVDGDCAACFDERTGRVGGATLGLVCQAPEMLPCVVLHLKMAPGRNKLGNLYPAPLSKLIQTSEKLRVLFLTPQHVVGGHSHWTLLRACHFRAAGFPRR